MELPPAFGTGGNTIFADGFKEEESERGGRGGQKYTATVIRQKDIRYNF
jgi:hypothetical protein